MYVYSLCGTQECTLFMQKTVTTLKEDEMISHYLWASSCNGNPTIDIVNSYKVTVYYPIENILLIRNDILYYAYSFVHSPSLWILINYVLG